MGKKLKYIHAIKKFLRDYANIPDDSENIHYEVVADKESGNFCLIRFGEDEEQWTHHCVFHFKLINDKVVVLQNWTDLKLEEELAALGIDRADINPQLYESPIAA
ncbi:MAG TPA: hypothetical protein ENJ95_02220 [Bacteroidetes bacterium]|nr:hypothetical protein [Bacteroidota bacterium]